MIRTLILTTALLAAAGAASAETIKVSLSGKTEADAKVEIAKATEMVCRDAPLMEYRDCVQETYQNAMAQVARIKVLRTASLNH
jgi:hypothetical protein